MISSIGRGLCVLIGIHKNDTSADIEFMVRKILNTRLFEDGNGKRWQLGVKDAGLEILCVSQFTLYCELKGNKPDYRHAMGAM
ncbi:D-tyrosyl-tRNA(Tyr) deacylase 1 [Penaeus vannamei]|uniref:D-aminoacyl-tRNA deacylase n=1 Tax=Penaeus vannamei TaxID=6689 RepID=A0A423TCQ9_PENVA|nr:D-tyrosyl-tRNA(Tyr) deacylase 1 [Penaeus vannamei]